MHPIMFRIPLPKTGLQLAWVMLALAGIALIAAVWQLVKKNRQGAITAGVIAVVGVVARFLLKGQVWNLDALPIYSYGVMLGLSLVVGWYLTLGLAERDGLPKELMANCYVDTAVAAVIGSRLLYVLTNLDEFKSAAGDFEFSAIFAMRRGGLVAYGGFLGGFVGSFLYLRYGVGVVALITRLFSEGSKKPWRPLPLLAWADVAVPSLASGLLITRIGCYLFGCDFGKPLCQVDGGACVPGTTWGPAWLQRLGTFPHWPEGTLEHGEGSPAWAQHIHQRGLSHDAPASLPVHPTQLYESLVGAALLVLLLVARRRQKFRGEIFLLFTFAYGVVRFLLEIVRDDLERGSIPPAVPEQWLIPMCLVLLGVGYVIGFSNMIESVPVRRVTQVLAFLPAVAFYFLLKPATFGLAQSVELSTSQAVAVSTGFAACIGFSVLYKAALAHPESAMALNLPPPEDGSLPDDDDEDDEEEEERAAKPARAARRAAGTKAGEAASDGESSKKKKRKKKKAQERTAASDEADETSSTDESASTTSEETDGDVDEPEAPEKSKDKEKEKARGAGDDEEDDADEVSKEAG